MVQLNIQTSDKFRADLQSPESQQMISGFENLYLDSFNDVNTAVAMFVNILESAVKNSLRLGNMKNKRTLKSHSLVCYEMSYSQKESYLYLKPKTKRPLHKQIRLSYNSLNNRIQRFIRPKKAQSPRY